LVNLEKLNTSDNQLISIPPEIGQLFHLISFHCIRNELTTLPHEIGRLVNLTILYCHDNYLTALPPEIGQLINLTHLNCFQNRLSFLPIEIGQLVNLTCLYCSDNHLTTLPPEIGKLVNLTLLHCTDNLLTTIPPEFGQLVNLTSFNYSNNPIEYIPPNLQRLIDTRLRDHQNIYNDKQSVHNSSIQASFRKSLNNLLRDQIQIDNRMFEKVLNEIAHDLVLTEKAKRQLIEYSENTDVQLELHVNFKEILCFVWNRILRSEDGDEIKKILSQEMNDADCMCFTGRITRLVNSLNGFFPDIILEINSAEQIGNIMTVIRNKLKNENRYSIPIFKEELSNELNERQYNPSVISEWLKYIE